MWFFWKITTFSISDPECESVLSSAKLFGKFSELQSMCPEDYSKEKFLFSSAKKMLESHLCRDSVKHFWFFEKTISTRRNILRKNSFRHLWTIMEKISAYWEKNNEIGGHEPILKVQRSFFRKKMLFMGNSLFHHFPTRNKTFFGFLDKFCYLNW